MRTTGAFLGDHFGFLAVALIAIAGVACGSSDDHHDDGDGTASGATCPSGSTLTYDNFGRNFMTMYCTRCHSSTAADRHDAPADHNFDTLAQIRTMAEHIDEEAAAGPTVTNESMPPDGAMPTDEERKQLGEWLACETGGGADSGNNGDGGGNGDVATNDTGTKSDTGSQGDTGTRGDTGTQTEGGRGDR